MRPHNLRQVVQITCVSGGWSVHQNYSCTVPVGDHAAVALALQTGRRFTDLLGGVEWNSQIDHAVGVVDRLTVDDRLFVGHEQLLFIGRLARPYAQLSVTAHCAVTSSSSVQCHHLNDIIIIRTVPPCLKMHTDG